MKLPMLDEAVQDEAARLPMLVEAILDEAEGKLLYNSILLLV